MSDALLLFILRALFPAWTITLGGDGFWRARGRVIVSASSSDGLLDLLVVVDPEGTARAIRLLDEGGGVGGGGCGGEPECALG